MKVVITGANSFIGTRLAERFSEEGWESVLVVRPGHTVQVPANAQLVPLSMDEYSKLGELTGGCDCFVHLSWQGVRGSQRMDKELQEANVVFSMQGIASVLRAGCAKVVLSGSQAEYGPQFEPTTEQAVCRPHTEYGKAKLALARQIADLCVQKNVAYKLLRIFSTYGPRNYPDTLIMSMLRNMRSNRPCELTPCTQQWDFLYIDDAVDAIIRICGLPCTDGIYNIASGDVRPLSEFVKEMLRVTKSSSRLLFGAIPYPETGKMSLWPDVTKLHKELNWQSAIQFETGIQRTMDWINESEKIPKL